MSGAYSQAGVEYAIALHDETAVRKAVWNPLTMCLNLQVGTKGKISAGRSVACKAARTIRLSEGVQFGCSWCIPSRQGFVYILQRAYVVCTPCNVVHLGATCTWHVLVDHYTRVLRKLSNSALLGMEQTDRIPGASYLCCVHEKQCKDA